MHRVTENQNSRFAGDTPSQCSKTKITYRKERVFNQKGERLLKRCKCKKGENNAEAAVLPMPPGPLHRHTHI